MLSICMLAPWARTALFSAESRATKLNPARLIMVTTMRTANMAMPRRRARAARVGKPPAVPADAQQGSCREVELLSVDAHGPSRIQESQIVGLIGAGCSVSCQCVRRPSRKRRSGPRLDPGAVQQVLLRSQVIARHGGVQ